MVSLQDVLYLISLSVRAQFTDDR